MTPLADGRQSERALAIARGTLRLLRSLDYAGIREFTLAHGRRADLIALNAKGDIWIVEIKSSVEDFRADSKWHEYMPFCDRFSFAVNAEFPRELIPREAGLIVADKFDAGIVRDAVPAPLAPARRKAVTLQFARIAASRMHLAMDPDAARYGSGWDA